MGAPVELKTVLSSSRGGQRRYEHSASETEHFSRASFAGLALAAVAIAKTLLFGASSAQAAEGGAETQAGEGRSGSTVDSIDGGGADEPAIATGKVEEPESVGSVKVRSHAVQSSEAVDGYESSTPQHRSTRAMAASNPIPAPAVEPDGTAPSPGVAMTKRHGSTGGGSSPTSEGRRNDRDENTAPVVRQPVVLQTSLVNQALLITLADLLQGVVDADADELGVSKLTSSSGHVTDNGDGTWTFVPDAGSSGPTTFSYEVTDGHHSVAAHASLEIAGQGQAKGEAITGSSQADKIIATDSADQVDAGGGDDFVYTASGNDRVHGGAGHDVIYGGAGDDVISGGAGNDFIAGGDGNDDVRGDDGNDVLIGGRGNDIVDGGKGEDRIVAGDAAPQGSSSTPSQVSGPASDGDDRFDGGEGTDTLDLSSIASDTVIDLASGRATGQQIGADTLVNIENVIAGAGNDTIIDSQGQNELTGGSGHDTFAFTGLDAPGTPEQADKIRDFESGDKIDISRIDADQNTGGHDALVFIGLIPTGSNLTLALKQMGFTFEAKEDGEHTYLFAKTSNAANDHDFTVDFLGHHELTSDDFIGLA